MNDADVWRRNHWISHIARHAQQKPGAVYLCFQGVSVPPGPSSTIGLSNASGKVMKTALRRQYGGRA